MALATLVVTGNSAGQLPITIFSKDVSGNTVEIIPGNGDHVWLYPILRVTVDTVNDPTFFGENGHTVDDGHH